MPEPISPNCSYEAATRSRTALRLGIDNTPSAETLERMYDVARECYEPAVAHFGFRIPISSFYRSAALNRAIGGAAKSQHLTGEAIDLDCDGTLVSNRALFDYFRRRGNFDQLIAEYPRSDGTPEWVHVSWSRTRNRGSVLVAEKVDGRTVYQPYRQGVS